MSKTWAKQSDIAKEAGVSIATVDRVINGRAGVSVVTTKRIWDTIDKIQGGVEHQKPIKIDVILPNENCSFLNHLSDSVDDFGGRYAREGVTIKRHHVKSYDPRSLADSLDKISTKTDGIAVIPMEDPFVRESIMNVCNKGIPVVTMLSSFNSQRTLGHIGPNNRAAGRTSAHLISMMTAGKTGKVAIFKGSQSYKYVDYQDRELGFVSAIKEYGPKLDVINGFEDIDDQEEAYEKAYEVISNNKDLIGIYSISGGTRSISRALYDLEKRDNIIWIGHELSVRSRELLLDGTMNAVINQEVSKEAENALHLLINYHRKNGTQAIMRPEEIKIDIFLRDNLP